MINELKHQLDSFIETCNDELLIAEAISLLHIKNWLTTVLKTGELTNHFVRTEEIFVKYRKQKIGLV